MPADFDISPILEPDRSGEQRQSPNTAQNNPVQQDRSTPLVSPNRFSGFPQTSMPRRPHPNRLLRWLALVAAVLFLVAIGSLFWGGNSFSDRDVFLEITANDRAVSGDEVLYTVRYRNNTGVELSDLRFRFFFPEDSIVLKDDKPTTPESEGFTVDRLSPGEEGTHEFSVFLIGDKGAIKTARVSLIFQAGTLRSSFEKEATIATAVTDLPVSLTLVAPPSASSGTTVQYILDIRNETEDELADMRLEFHYPDGFTPQELHPQADEGKTLWNIERLSSGEGKRFTVTGTLEGNERDVKNVEVVLRRNLNGQYIDYVKTDESTTISSPLLSISIAPREGKDYTSFPGDTLHYSISYRNDSRYTFLGMRLVIALEGEMYDVNGIQAPNGSFDESTHSVVFDASGIPELAQFPPGRSGGAAFSVPLKAGLSGAVGTQAFFVKATARLSTSNIPSGLSSEDATTADSIITRITSKPALLQEVRYDGDAQSGPLPPQVGQETNFTIRWQISNPGNEVRNTTVTAVLAPGVTWRGDALAVNGGSAPTYDAGSRTVTWNIGTLPFGTGNGTPRYEAHFRISIQPSSSQVGQAVSLMNATTLSGVDAFTNTEVRSQLNGVTTDSIEGHTDEGRVVQ